LETSMLRFFFNLYCRFILKVKKYNDILIISIKNL